VEIVKLLLKRIPDVNLQDKFGITALIYACWCNNAVIVELLLKHNPNVNLHDKDCWTALIYACKNSNANIVKLLLEHNPDVSLKDKDGKTAHKYAKNECSILLENYRRVPSTLKNIIMSLLEQQKNKVELTNLKKMAGKDTFAMLTRPHSEKINRERVIKKTKKRKK